MNPAILIVSFLVGCALVAFWVERRFPDLAPRTMRGTLVHVGATLVAAQLLAPLVINLVTGSPRLTLLAVFAVAFPALTYSLLVAIWVMKLLQGAMRGLLR